MVKLLRERPTGTIVKELLFLVQVPEVAAQVVELLEVNSAGRSTMSWVRAVEKLEWRVKGEETRRVKLEG